MTTKLVHPREPYQVQEELTRVVMWTGTYAQCKNWVRNQPDWERYVIVDPKTNQVIAFTVRRQ